MILQLMMCCLCQVRPIAPTDLEDALQAPVTGAAATELVARIKATLPKDWDLSKGAHLIEHQTDAIAFVIEAPSAKKPPRLGGMLNHSRGLDLVALGDTGVYARVERIPTDTKFAYHFEVDGKKVGASTVEMPDWSYPLESKKRPERKYGEYKPLRFRSAVFENNRTGWIYVPAAYDGKAPVALMVFQDGDAYKNEHVGTVVDNLIADKSIPPMILVLLNPGVNDDGKSNRSVEYDTLSDRYVRFLESEVLPLARKEYRVRDGAADHAIGGASSGGICSFTAAWQRPELFGRVCSQIGSFTNIRGGHVYPDLVRAEPRKPIKVFLHDGTNDLINQYGDWWAANEAMYKALSEKGYSVDFLKDRGFHAYWTCGRQLPEALRKTWAGWTP